MHHCRAGYYGLVNHVDMQLNRLFQYMRDRRLLENTFIMFVSDHGERLGDHHLFAKTWPYEASTRVPFLARAPRSMEFPRQVQVAAPVGLQDVMPTLLDVAGCEIPESVTGSSVLPWMRGETPEWRDVLHGEHAGQYREADGNQWGVTGSTSTSGSTRPVKSACSTSSTMRTRGPTSPPRPISPRGDGNLPWNLRAAPRA